jgi:hypothetical protein
MNETPPKARVVIATKKTPIALAGLPGIRPGSRDDLMGNL